VRVGIHTGLGLLKENDIFGDVVNAASRVQRQAQPDQILITGAVLDSARATGLQCAAFGKAEIEGKDEPIDVYAVVWSETATEQIIDQIQAKFEAKLKDFKHYYQQLEEEFETSRDQWRAERRKLIAETEQLEEAAARARQEAHSHVSSDLQAEM